MAGDLFIFVWVGRRRGIREQLGELLLFLQGRFHGELYVLRSGWCGTHDRRTTGNANVAGSVLLVVDLSLLF